ncbi:MAG: tetratricopeptide repeat protein [Candidatus Hodarchaeota archaeon]
MSHSELKELTQAKKLINEGKYDEALQLIDNLEQMKNLTLQDKVSCQLLKCNLLFWQWKFEEMLKIADQTYKESLELGRNLQSVDALLLSAKVLKFLDREEEAINDVNQAEELLKKFTQELPEDYMQREAQIYLVKGMKNLSSSYKTDDQLKFLEQSLVLGEKLGNKVIITESLYIIAGILGMKKGELNHAIEYLKRSLLFAEESNSKYNIAWVLAWLMIFHKDKGELDRGLMYGEQCLQLFEKINNKQWIAASLTQIGDIYKAKGNFGQALEHLERGLTLREELGVNMTTAITLCGLIELAVDMGDLVLAQKYFNRLKQLNEQEDSKWINLHFRFTNANLLKTSTRAKNRVKAEEIYKEIIEEEGFYLKVDALLELCDLLLVELRITNDAEVLKEIKTNLNRILESSEKINSFRILAETYLLQAKVALITFDTNEARRFLTRAQEIAEKYGLNLIAMKISNEHDELIKQLDVWDKLKESKAPLSERLKLAQLNEQMEKMIRKREIAVPEITDEDPIVLLIISEGGRPVFSESFAEEWAFEDHLFGGFLTAINSFSDEMFSEGLNRANFGEYTIIMNSLHPFLVCYLFKGQSYRAQQRVIKFIDNIKEDTTIWKTFNEYNQTCRMVQLEDIPSLEPLITKIFIEKSVPLIA